VKNIGKRILILSNMRDKEMTHRKLKVMTILGTRPEIIRLSETIKKLDEYFDHVLVHTNQNYDYELNQIFFDELKLRKPDYKLDVKSETVGEQIGKILAQCERVMLKEKPEAVLILGDTNSSLAGIIAKRLKIIIFHMEAGNRCFDDRVPEEINRRIIDHTADINLCYSEHARRNLLREGLDSQNIFVTGTPLAEVYNVNKAEIEKSKILETLGLEKGKYFLASIHREENIDNQSNIESILAALNNLHEEYKLPIIFSTHPRTKKKLEQQLQISTNGITFHKPFGMFDYIALQQGAFFNLSDSGTIHEDAAIFGIPAINIRESNERPEVYDTGNVVMTGVDSRTIVNAIRMIRIQTDSGVNFERPADYLQLNCSEKIARLILGLTKIVSDKKYHR
jgi:UDP-N-acetylglucosamine 2-epimerase (non-hydrolysing)